MNCLPFNFVGSSTPLTLQSEVSDHGFTSLATDPRPSPRLSRQASVESQPSPTQSSTMNYCQSSRFERRRGNLSLDSVPNLKTMGEVGRQFRRSKSAPSNTFTLPAVHEIWVGVSQAERVRGKRSASEPIKPSHSIIDINTAEKKLNKGLIPPPQQNPALYSVFSSHRSSANSIQSSRFSTSSTLTPSHLSPVFRPDNRVSLASSVPPAPSRHALAEDGAVTKTQSVKSRASFQPRSRSHARSASMTYSHSRTSSIHSTAESLSISRPQSAASQRSLKKVSFSIASDLIINTDNDMFNQSMSETRSHHRKASWSGVMLANPLPVAVRSEFTRRTTLPSVRGKVAGPSILRRTSSFETRKNNITNEGVNSVLTREPAPKMSEKNVGPPLPTLLPSLPEDDDDDAVNEYLDMYIDEIFAKSSFYASDSSASSSSSSSSPSSSPWSPPSHSSISSISSSSSPSSLSSPSSHGSGEEYEDDDDFLSTPFIIPATPKAMTISRPRRHDVQTIVVSSAPSSGSVYIACPKEERLPARYQKMQGVERWVQGGDMKTA